MNHNLGVVITSIRETRRNALWLSVCCAVPGSQALWSVIESACSGGGVSCIPARRARGRGGDMRLIRHDRILKKVGGFCTHAV